MKNNNIRNTQSFLALKNQKQATSKISRIRKNRQELYSQLKTPTSEKKPRQQVKNMLQQEIIQLNTTKQINYDQLVYAVMDLKLDQKFEEGQQKFMEKVELSEQDELRLMSQICLQRFLYEKKLEKLFPNQEKKQM